MKANYKKTRINVWWIGAPTLPVVQRPTVLSYRRPGWWNHHQISIDFWTKQDLCYLYTDNGTSLIFFVLYLIIFLLFFIITSSNLFLYLLFSCLVMSDSVRLHGLQNTRFPCLSTIFESMLKTCPLSQGCIPTISSSVVPFSSCLQSFPASRSFPMSQFFASGSQSIGASSSVLPINGQDWFPLGLTGWISLKSKGLSRVFSNTTVQKHQFFSTQPSLWSNYHIHTWLLGKP